MGYRELACALALLASAAGAAYADNPDARVLYAEGEYVAAGESAARDTASADAQAFAAKAYAAAAMLADFADDSSEALTEAARVHAEAAIRIDPRHVEGRLQLAVALWLESRRRGRLEAYVDGMPQQGRALIESAAADAPDEAWAHALLGAWHFEALRRGGGWAKRLLDADLVIGRQEFERAIALDPADVAVAAQYGLAYLSVDPEEFSQQAAAALDHALRLTPRDAFEAALQERAREARALIAAEDHAALESAVARWFGG